LRNDDSAKAFLDDADIIVSETAPAGESFIVCPGSEPGQTINPFSLRPQRLCGETDRSLFLCVIIASVVKI